MNEEIKIRLNTIINSSCMDVELPLNSVDVIVTSPPYFRCRVNNVVTTWHRGDPDCKHEWEATIVRGMSGGKKSKKVRIKGTDNFQITTDQVYKKCVRCGTVECELGWELTLEEYVDHLVSCFDNFWFSLKDYGSVWVVIGDKRDANGFLLSVPHIFSNAMQRSGWGLIDDITWKKDDCFPQSCKNRYTQSTERIFRFIKAKKPVFYVDEDNLIVSKSKIGKQHKMFFTQQFEPLAHTNVKSVNTPNKHEGYGVGTYSGFAYDSRDYPYGRNHRDVWAVSKGGFSGKHFSTYPPRLVEKMLAGTLPLGVCSKCGLPKVVVFKKSKVKRDRPNATTHRCEESSPSPNDYRATMIEDVKIATCECGVGFNRSVVLDPFGGANTTGMVAKRMGGDYICIEPNTTYPDRSKK